GCTAVGRVQPPGPAISARVPEGPCKSISVQSECPRTRLLARIRSRKTVIEPNAGAEDQASVAEMRRRGIEGVAERYCRSYRPPFAGLVATLAVIAGCAKQGMAYPPSRLSAWW